MWPTRDIAVGKCSVRLKHFFPHAQCLLPLDAERFAIGASDGCGRRVLSVSNIRSIDNWWSDEGNTRKFGNFPKMPRCHVANDEVKSPRWWWWRTSNLWRASAQSCRKFGTSMWLVLEDITVLITTWPHEVGLKIVILSGHPKLLDKKYRRKQKLWC